MSFTLDNFVRSILAVDAAVGDTSLVVALAAPPLRDPPAASADAPGILILQDQPTAPTKIEIVTYTGVSIVGTQVTLSGVTRGLEGTTAQAWTAGTQTFSGSTAAVLAQFALSANLGTASSHAATDFATAAQGAKADSAIQPTAAFSISPGVGPKVTTQYPSYSLNPNNDGETALFGGWSNIFVARVWKGPGDTSDYAELLGTFNGALTWRSSAAAGAQTVWHAGNFNPANYIPKTGGAFTGTITAPNLSGTNTGDQDLSGFMPKAGGTFTGAVYFPCAAGSFWIGAGSGDGATLTTYNTKITTNYGVGIAAYDGVVRGVFDARAGRWIVTKPALVAGANGAAPAQQPRVFVQSADPGAAAADGDLWFW